MLVAQKTDAIAELLRDGKIDCGIVEGSIKGNEFNISNWFSDELRLYVSTHHQWANDTIEFADLVSAPLFMRESGSGHHQTLTESFRTQQVELADMNIIMELGSTEAVKLAVEAGLGCAFLSEWSCRKELLLHLLAPVRIKNFTVTREFSIVQTRESENNALVQRFVSYLHKIAPRFAANFQAHK